VYSDGLTVRRRHLADGLSLGTRSCAKTQGRCDRTGPGSVAGGTHWPRCCGGQTGCQRPIESELWGYLAHNKGLGEWVQLMNAPALRTQDCPKSTTRKYLGICRNYLARATGAGLEYGIFCSASSRSRSRAHCGRSASRRRTTETADQVQHRRCSGTGRTSIQIPGEMTGGARQFCHPRGRRCQQPGSRLGGSFWAAFRGGRAAGQRPACL
jgi:hypothetical protein